MKDDVQFAVTKLDLSGFKLKKEGEFLNISFFIVKVVLIICSLCCKSDVTVTLGKSINDEFLSCEARNISASFNSVRWKYQQLYFPYLSGNGVADASAQNASIKIGERIAFCICFIIELNKCILYLMIGFKLVRVPKGIVAGLAGEFD